MKKLVCIGIISAGIAAAIGSVPLVEAHGGATGVVKERMELMKSLGGAMKTMKAMFQNQSAYNASEIRKAANTIRSLAGGKLTGLFPEGSLEKPSEALPVIWKDWQRFQSLATDLSVFAGTLDAAADNRMALGRGNMMMGRGNMMQGGGNMMMGGKGPNPAALKSMPAMASFMRISKTCSTCHTDYRKKKDQ